MCCPRFKECLVLLVLFYLGSSSPPHERSLPSRSAPSLDDFPENYEPLSTVHPYRFYFDQLMKKSDSNQEKKLPRFYNMDNPVERLRIKLHKLVNIFIDWIKNLD